MSVDFDLDAELARVRTSLQTETDRLAVEIAAMTERRKRLVATLRTLESVDLTEPGETPPPAPLQPLGPEPTPSGGFVCPPPCGRTFDSEHGLNVHRARTHGRPTPATGDDADGRPLCPECNEPFSSKANLIRHRTRRHGYDPGVGEEFRCDPCELTFPNAQGLGAHRRHHHPKGAALPVSSPSESVTEPEAPKVTAGGPIERRPFDPDAARVAAAGGIGDADLDNVTRIAG